MSTTKRNY